MLPWSVMATAGMPSRCASANRGATLAAPWSIEYSVGTCRCTKDPPVTDSNLPLATHRATAVATDRGCVSLDPVRGRLARPRAGVGVSLSGVCERASHPARTRGHRPHRVPRVQDRCHDCGNEADRLTWIVVHAPTWIRSPSRSGVMSLTVIGSGAPLSVVPLAEPGSTIAHVPSGWASRIA